MSIAEGVRAPGPTPTGADATTCAICHEDQDFLRGTTRPAYETLGRPVRVVDLFSGGGGLSLGAAEAARRAGRGTTMALAVEVDDSAADLYAVNFPQADLRRSDITKLFDGKLGAPLTKPERALQKTVGHVDVLVAGPPCQGHSDLNNSTRRRDPRNVLYLRAIRAAQVLRPTYVVIENVPAVLNDKGKVVDKAFIALKASGYTVADAVLDLVKFGVPQRRRRHILLGVRGPQVDPSDLLEMRSPCGGHGDRTVEWAISDLAEIAAETGPDAPSKASHDNLVRMKWLHARAGRTDLPNSMRPECHRDKEHTYNSMYGRLSWDRAAQTITTGFGSMGQGRFVHPGLPRILTPHEAARLQTLPDFYELDATKGRGVWAMVIGNAVPPLLGVHLVEPLICALPAPPDETQFPGATSSPPGTTRNSKPRASSELIRLRMKATKRRDTKPELALRSALFSKRLRFQVDRTMNGNRSKTDVVFPSERVAVYVDGCFWHGCPDHGTIPRQNRQWWLDKLEANKARDLATTEALIADGWHVLRFWEHEDATAAADVVYREVLAIRAGNGNAAPRDRWGPFTPDRHD